MQTATLFLFCLAVLAYSAPLKDSLIPGFQASGLLAQAGHCDTVGNWQAYAFLVEDCFRAIQQLYIENVIRHPDEIYEFRSFGARPKTSYTTVPTPASIVVSEYSY